MRNNIVLNSFKSSIAYQFFLSPIKSFLTVPPQISPFEFSEDSVDAEEYTSVTCTVFKGDFPIQISWKHNGYNITPVEGITISRTSKRNSQLSIDSVQASHSGEYLCIAKNKAGEASYSANLNVNGY